MTQTEFEQCIVAIGWSLLGTAKRLNIPENTLRRLVQRGDLPEAFANYLRLVAKAVLRVPVPQR